MFGVITHEERMTGADFEAKVEDRLTQYAEANRGTFGRYGVQAVRTRDDWIIMRSLPDFEGVTWGGRQVIMDCKVCSFSSMSLADYRSETRGPRSRQLRHMLKRSRYEANCFFLIHWNSRDLKDKTIGAETWAVPVKHDMDYWHKVEGGEVKSISLADCRRVGVRIPWIIPQGRRSLVVDLGPQVPELEEK